jgi:hypothetical protein
MGKFHKKWDVQFDKEKTALEHHKRAWDIEQAKKQVD